MNTATTPIMDLASRCWRTLPGLCVSPCANHTVACIEKLTGVRFANPDPVTGLSAQCVPIHQLLNVDTRSNLAAAGDMIVVSRLVLTLLPRMDRVARPIRLPTFRYRG